MDPIDRLAMTSQVTVFFIFVPNFLTDCALGLPKETKQNNNNYRSYVCLTSFGGGEAGGKSCVIILCSLLYLDVMGPQGNISSLHVCKSDKDHRFWAFPCWLQVPGPEPLHPHKISKQAQTWASL